MGDDVDTVVGHVRCRSQSSVTLLRCQGHDWKVASDMRSEATRRLELQLLKATGRALTLRDGHM